MDILQLTLWCGLLFLIPVFLLVALYIKNQKIQEHSRMNMFVYSLADNAFDDLLEWRSKNPDVHIGTHHDGRKLVIQCLRTRELSLSQHRKQNHTDPIVQKCQRLLNEALVPQ